MGEIAKRSVGGKTLRDMTSDATATAPDILGGKTAYVKGSKITGQLSSLEKAKLYLVYSAVVTDGEANGAGGLEQMEYYDDYTIKPSGGLNLIGKHWTNSANDFGGALIGKYCGWGRITNAWNYMGGNVSTIMLNVSVKKLGYGVTDTPNPFPKEQKCSDGNWRINVNSTNP